MDAQQFLAEFGHIASAPNGVQRLREMVLQLAVMGALTKQDPKEGQASGLIALAQKKKRDAIEKNQFKTTAKLESLALEIPREIILPENWEWARLLDLGEINPRNDCKDNLDVSFLPMGSISQSYRGSLSPERRKWGEIKKGFTHIADGDVILAKITPCFENGKSAIVSGLVSGFGGGTTELHVFRALPGIVNTGYVYIYLRSPHFAFVGEANMTGTAGQKRLPTEYFASRAFPLPPLAEQKRIVAKVDELMALCDKLEALQNQRKVARTVLTKEILGCVASDTKVDAQTCLQNLSLLVSDVEQIPVLRQTILSLAVQGKLSSSYETDGDASQQLKEGMSNVTEVVSRKRKGMDFDLGDIQGPFQIPKKWIWCWLRELALDIQYGYTASANPKFTDYRMLRITDIQENQVNWTTVPGCEVDPDVAEKYLLKTNDLLIARTGGTIGKTFLVNDVPVKSVFASYLIRISPLKWIDARYLKITLESPMYWKQLRHMSAGTGQPNVNGQALGRLKIPLPPLAEQKRIVAKVDELMALCDRLETKLRKASQVQEQLAISAIAALTGIHSQEQETMKAPKTELVARLKIGKKPSAKDQAPLAALLVRHQGDLDSKLLWQHSGMERIDDFYHQLKFEMNQGWIVQPEIPTIRVVGDR